MPKNYLLAAKSIKPPGDEKPVDNNLRQQWNNYVDWLEKKGLKGHPSLDTGGKGFQMIEQYRKENPTTLISKESIIPIQKEFSKYRDYAINEIENGRGHYADGANKDNFMRALSIVDGVPGQRTTSFKFPDFYLKHLDTGVTENKGFATIQK